MGVATSVAAVSGGFVAVPHVVHQISAVKNNALSPPPGAARAAPPSECPA